MGQNTVTCPLEIEIALHYHCNPDQYRGGNFSAPAVKAGIQKLVGAGLIVPLPSYPTSYRATDALRIYVDALCKTPFPVMRWVMP